VFGILSAFFGGGALLGALIQAARSKASWKGLLLGATGFSTGLLLLAPVTTVWLACAILFAVGVCFTLWVSNTSAILQLRAPDRLRGRVMSLFMFAFAGLAPIGGLFAGFLMDVGGTELALTVGGAVSLVVVGLAWIKHTGFTLRPRQVLPVFAAEEEEASRAA
jgi:MFS family permease